MRELEDLPGGRQGGRGRPRGLLVIDATAGQNALAQAREFTKAPGSPGSCFRMDGTAKGGIALAIRQELGIPVKFVGTGETPEDLAEFDPAVYAEGLVGD